MVADGLDAVVELLGTGGAFAAAMQGLNEAVSIADLRGVVRFCNERYCAGSGYEPDEILGKPLTALIADSDHVLLAEERARDALDGISSKFQLPVVRKDGTTIWAEVRVGPIRNAGGEIVGTITASSDITTTRKAQARLEAAVRSRTEELQNAVSLLRREIGERQAAELLALGQKRVLFETLDALVRNPDLDAVLGVLLRATNQALGVPSSGLWLRIEQSDRAQLYCSCVDMPMSMPLKSYADIRLNPSALQDLFIDRKPHIVDVEATQEELPAAVRELYQQHGVKATLNVPIRRADQTTGFIAVRRHERKTFSDSEVELAVALADQAALAIEMRHLVDRSTQMAILDERNRLAREIHDSLAQAFTGVLLHCTAVDQSLDKDDAKARDHLSKIRSLAKDGLAEARRSVNALRPAALEREDLAGALSRIAVQLSGAATEVRVDSAGMHFPLPPRVEECFLRIGQEAIGNAVRHSGAERVHVSVEYGLPRLTLRVSDRGRGFGVESSMGRGYGIESMRERARSEGLVLDIKSVEGQGTEVVLVAPDASRVRS